MMATTKSIALHSKKKINCNNVTKLNYNTNIYAYWAYFKLSLNFIARFSITTLGRSCRLPSTYATLCFFGGGN